MTAKLVFSLSLSLYVSEAAAQSNEVSLLLRDPYETKGWYLLDLYVCRDLGVEQVKVSVKAASTLPNGTRQERILETISSTGKHYVKADLTHDNRLLEHEQLTYSVAGLDASGTVIVEQDGLRIDEPAWPELCRETCEGPWWAWTLIARSAEGLGSIELNGYAEDGVPAYVYCRTNDWQAFKAQFPSPSQYFGIGTAYWSQVESAIAAHTDQYGNAVMKIPVSLLPADARDYQGYPITDPTPYIWAVRKGLGPWMTMGSVWTDIISAQGLCLPGPHQLMDVYNDRPEIQAALEWRAYDELACPSGSGSGGGLS